MTTTIERHPSKRGRLRLAGLSLATLPLLLPGAALAEGGPAMFMHGVIMAWAMLGLTMLGIWLLICLGGLWLFLRRSKTRGEKAGWCVTAAIAFVMLPLIDKKVLRGGIGHLFFDLPIPVLQFLMVGVTVLYVVLAFAGIGWGLAKLGKRLSARSGKTVADNDKD